MTQRSGVGLDGAVVLVTGANGGLGVEFVRQALESGAAKVYAAARRPAEHDWVDARVVPLTLDVTDAASIVAAASAAGDVTVLINNAGASVRGERLIDLPLDTTRAIFETNVFGVIALAQAFAPQLAEGGAIINVASALSWLATPGPYSASKAAVWSVSNTLRIELAGAGTQVLTAHLGYTDTPMTAGLDVPKGRAEDVVAAVYDGLEAGAYEVLADETSRNVKAALSAPVEALYPGLVTV